MVELIVDVDPFTVKFPESVRLTAVASPVSAGDCKGAFKSNADNAASETGLFASEVLSTLDKPTSDLIIPVGVFIAGDVRVLFVRVCVPVVVASMLVSAMPCTAVVSDS